VSCYRLIDAEKANYSVSMLCKVLTVSRSGYYAWRDRSPSRRERENATLIEQIREIHHRSRGTYGYPRVHAELRALGVRCNRKRVARLMRKERLQGCIRGRRRRKHITRQDPLAVPAPDLVERNFCATPHPIDCGRRTSHICSRMRAFSTWPSSSMSTRAKWWAGRWQTTCAVNW
jgi:putative transposase